MDKIGGGSGRRGWCAPIGTRRFWGVRPDPTNLYTPVLDLERKLRCRECDAKGKAVISVRWGERRIGLGPALREAVIEVCNGVDSGRLAARLRAAR